MYHFLMSNIMWVWLGLFIVFLGIEAATVNLTTIWAAISSFLMIFISKTNMPVRWQILVFLVLTIVLILVTRPFCVKKLHMGKDRINLNSMIGQEVLCVKSIKKFERGEVKAKNGVIWTATAENDEEIAENTVCKIKEINGNNLVVSVK